MTLATRIPAMLVLLISFSTFAAAPLMHLVVAKEYLSHIPFDTKEFMLGTVFPDIRYLGDITRNETHEYGLTLSDIRQAPTSFKAGMRLHSFLDEEREAFAIQEHIYDRLEEVGGKYVGTLLKFIEDEILHDTVEAASFIPYFKEIMPAETDFGISVSSASKWHFFVTQYLSRRPSRILSALAMTGQPFFDVPAAMVQQWSKLLPELAKQDRYREYTKKLLEHFALLFEQPQI